MRDEADARHSAQEETSEPQLAALMSENSGFSYDGLRLDWATVFKHRDLLCSIQTKSSTFKWADGRTTAIKWAFKD